MGLGSTALAQEDPPAPATGQAVDFEAWFINGPGSTIEDFLVQIPLSPLSTPRKSPKNAWEFPWIVPGLARTPSQPDVFTLRFRTYIQTRDPDRDLAPLVTRMLLQLYGYNIRKLRLEHSNAYFLQLVDVYLCDEGKPGGEQLFGEDPFNLDAFGRPRRANQIYIYDLPSFTEPVEMAREIAHEYGHATLPPIGQFEKPESWGNGYLGENLYLTWMLRDMKAERLSVLDLMGTTSAELGKYYQEKIVPLWSRIAEQGPSPADLKRTDEKAMDSFVGTALWAEAILPESAFRRSLMLADQDGSLYPKAILDAVNETEGLTLNIPAEVRGRAIWIPLGNLRLNGLNPIRRKDGWVQVRPTAEIMRLLPAQTSSKS